jgi:sialate O-acetylesterase
MDVEYSTEVDENCDFSIEIPPVVAGGPYRMTVRGSSEIIISDIYFGEVFLLSGQSNMEQLVERVLDVSEEEIKHTHEPLIRQYLIPATYNFKESEKYMYASSWKSATGQDLMGFSAVGLFFAKNISSTYKMPIGLIMTAVGGSIIEAWMNPVTLRQYGETIPSIEAFKDIAYFNSHIQEQQREADAWSADLIASEHKLTKEEDYKKWDTCMVPSLVSDYGKEGFSGSVILRREITLDQEPVEENAYIYMGSIIDSDQLWINDKLIGSTEYRYPPRKYSIPKGVLRKGSNLITIRIVINNNNGGTIKERPYYLYCDGKRMNLEGEWHYRIAKKAQRVMPSVLFPPLLPVCFYHTAIVPLSKINIKGVLWYQGESNTGNPETYAAKFTDMVADWRSLYGWKVPFIYAQLSNYREPLNDTDDSGWAELRNQQRLCLSIEQVAMAVTLDIGEASDIHPQNKKEVGIRLAKAARHLIYQEKIAYSGPLPDNVVVTGNNVVIRFLHLEDTEDEGSLNNFELASESGEFYEAIAIRKGKFVTVSSISVETPIAVRYAWCDCPRNINFFNEHGLPASGFRLDVI